MTSYHVICGLGLTQSRILGTPMNWRSPEKKLILKTFFFGERLRLCPWSLALASSIPVLGLERFCPRKGCPWPWPRIFFVSLALASSLVSSTPPLLKTLTNAGLTLIQQIVSLVKCHRWIYFELESLSTAESDYLPPQTSRSLISKKFLQTHACCDVTNRYGVKRIKTYFCE